MARFKLLHALRPASRAAALAGATLIAVLALGLAVHRGVAAERAAPPPVLGRVVDFTLLDQSSTPVSQATLGGEPWVASFLFTRCTTICPRLGERMRAVQALSQRSDPRLRLVTFSVDPEHDAPDVLKAYADAFGADGTRWRFLTGSEQAIGEIARSFAVALEGEVDPEQPNFGIMHSGHLILVDGRGRIRGYYPSAEEGVEHRILDDLQRIGAAS